MEKTYSPKDIEQKWYDIWEKNNYFAADKNATKDPYCIMIPPPNVTGHLHMGHAFQNAIMDLLIRYNRMNQHETLWQVGTDHAGIATQMVVERNLLKGSNQSRHDLGRENFVKKIWEWKEQSGNTITRQFRILGASVDWTKERFTMDAGLSSAVQTVFIKLYEEGLIYRGQRLVNWDPILHTAVSDLEVVSVEEKGELWHIKYPLLNSKNQFLIVATTRPETMLGDVAVAVNPNDSRYSKLIGQTLTLPLCDREIPIIADEYVDPAFGSGCVKITPAHDFNDYAIGERHNLPKINIFDVDAKLNQNSPTKYQGLDRFKAREQIVKDLKALDLIEKIEPHTLNIPRCDRTNAIVEPYLTDQWFVKTSPLAKPAIDAVKTNKIKFIPENWSKTYFEWMNNIQDWCISRQLWWGHRIPAWYDPQGNIYVGENEADIRKKYKLTKEIILTQDEDVLDTWFSSSLWPFSTLGWPEQTEELKKFYPTNVLVTGFDIIFFWVARMIMFGLKFTGKIPFKEVYIHGLIQDHDGQKMSKSKGNVLDPLDLIYGIDLDSLIEKRTSGLMQPQMEKKIISNTKKQFPNGIPSFGTDALRFTFCALATNNRHIRFDLARVEGYRNFCNKLWNAARFVFMNTEATLKDLNIVDIETRKKVLVGNINININGAGTDSGSNINDVTFNLADQWILSKLQKVKANVLDHIAKYRFDLAAQDLYEFVWYDYCDWYLEFSKPILSTKGEANKQHIDTTQFTLIAVLDEILRLLHPFMPFITEEIWQKVKEILNITESSVLIKAHYPTVNTTLINETIEQNISFVQKLILGIRNIRGEMNISPNKQLKVFINNHTKEQFSLINNNLGLIKSLAKLENIIYLDNKDNLEPCATSIADNVELLIPIKGLIDIDAEIKRLTKELNTTMQELEKSSIKLKNPSYINKAPKEVVDKERVNYEELLSLQDKLQENLNKIRN